MSTTMLLRGEDYDGGTTRDEFAGQIPAAAREVYELTCVTGGWAEYWIEDQHYKLTAGDVLLIPAGKMVGATLKQRGCPFSKHAIWMSRRFMTFLRLQDAGADHAFRQAAQQHRYVIRLPQDELDAVVQQFEAMTQACREDALNAELCAKAQLSTLLVALNRLLDSREETLLVPGDGNRLSAVLAYIHDHCTEALMVDKLAQQFEYSPSHLAHSFKKQMGTSLYHYVLMRRLQIGREAMLEGVPVKEAYQKCGFGDYAGFYRAFTKEFGMSPQQYKKRNQ